MTEEIGITIVQAVGLILPVTIFTARFTLELAPDDPGLTHKKGKLYDTVTWLVARWLFVIVVFLALAGTIAAASLVLSIDDLLLQISLIMLGAALFLFIPLLWGMKPHIGADVIE